SRFGQIEVARDGADALAFVEDQPDGLRLEIVVESATRSSPLGGFCHRCGHRIRLSESVHKTGSSPHANIPFDTGSVFSGFCGATTLWIGCVDAICGASGPDNRTLIYA